MAVISQNQSDYLNGLLKAGGGNAAWARTQLQGSSVMPQADPALVAQHQAAANQFKTNNWGPNGTANGLTESQNLAAVINQPGNTVQNNLTPYLSNVLTQAGRDSAPQSQVSSPQVQQPQFQAQQYQQPQQYQPQQQGQSATDLINSIYQSQLAAQQQQNKQNRDNLLAGISGQDALANQNATNQLNQNDVSGARNTRILNEHMANQGLGASGDYISAQVGQNTAQGQNANLINQNLTNSLNGNLAQRNAINNNANASDLAIMQNLQGQQSSNLLSDLYKSRDFGLQQAGVTGQYGGQNTMQQNQNNFSNGIQQGTLTGYYNGPQGQQQNGYGQNNNQQGYGQNQNTGMSGNYQNNGQGGRGYDPGFSMSGNQTNDPGFAMRNNFIGDGSRSGNGFQTGMGVSPLGIRTLGGQQLDLQSQKQGFDQNLQTKQFDLNSTQTMAQLTGKMPDGTPTSAQQQLQLTNEWKASDESGVISPALAQLYGIPAGTPTQAAKQFAQNLAIQQQNANTQATSVANSYDLGLKNNAIAQGNQDLARANEFGAYDPATGQQSISYLNKVQAGDAAKVSNLLDVWKESGSAPAGIPGVKEGTPLNSATVQQQQLANAYKTWNETGVAPIGIPGVAPGTPKYSASANNKANLSGKLGGYAADLDALKLPPADLKKALEGEKAKIIKETSVADYNRLYSTYFDLFGNPK